MSSTSKAGGSKEILAKNITCCIADEISKKMDNLRIKDKPGKMTISVTVDFQPQKSVCKCEKGDCSTKKCGCNRGKGTGCTAACKCLRCSKKTAK